MSQKSQKKKERDFVLQVLRFFQILLSLFLSLDFVSCFFKILHIYLSCCFYSVFIVPLFFKKQESCFYSRFQQKKVFIGVAKLNNYNSLVVHGNGYYSISNRSSFWFLKFQWRISSVLFLFGHRFHG